MLGLITTDGKKKNGSTTKSLVIGKHEDLNRYLGCDHSVITEMKTWQGESLPPAPPKPKKKKVASDGEAEGVVVDAAVDVAVEWESGRGAVCSSAYHRGDGW